MKTVLAIIVALILCFSLAACSSGDSGDTDTPDNTGDNTPDSTNEPSDDGGDTDDTVVCYSFGPMTGGAAWGQFERGFMTACEELGWEGHYLAPTADNNMSQLFNLHETAITNGADVMIPLVTDTDAMSDILDTAVEKGITMVGCCMGDPHFPGYIGTDPTNLGYTVAEALVKCMGDQEIHVVTMQTLLSTQSQVDQVDAFEEKLMELRPDATIVRREECNSSAQTAQDKLSAVCIANPETNALVSFDSYAGLGAATYVEAEGRQDDFCVIGIDDAAEILLAIKAGNMDATVAQMWYKMGYESVYLANDVREGKEIPEYTDSGTSIIMPEDVDAWAEEMGTDLSA